MLNAATLPAARVWLHGRREELRSLGPNAQPGDVRAADPCGLHCSQADFGEALVVAASMEQKAHSFAIGLPELDETAHNHPFT
jgi:hypothetical protein